MIVQSFFYGTMPSQDYAVQRNSIASVRAAIEVAKSRQQSGVASPVLDNLVSNLLKETSSISKESSKNYSLNYVIKSFI